MNNNNYVDTAFDRVFDKVMHFFVHNGFLITAGDMCLTHAGLLIIYCLAKVYPLVYFNIVSVIIYLFCVLLCIYGHPIPVYISIIIEVTTYAIVGVYYAGWQSGTAYFLCAIVPVTLYFGSILLDKRGRPIIMGLLISNFAIYTSLYLVFSTKTPQFKIPQTLIQALVILASFTMVFSTIFYNAVYIFSMRIKNEILIKDNKHLHNEAVHDGLTGWLNRTGFYPLLIDEVSKDNLPLSLVFIDIDNFKRVNDTYGHDCGDEILRHVTRIIKSNFGDSGIFCRWGGEELVLALKGHDIESAASAMDIVRHVIQETDTVFYNKHIKVTVSVGVAEYFTDNPPSDEVEIREQLESIITLADQRMYKGKQNGKNIVIST